MRTILSVLLCLALLFFVSCDPDGGSDLNPTQEKIKLLLDELKLADEEVMAYRSSHSGNPPAGYSESGTTRTYTDYTNAHGVLIDGTDDLSALPVPQYGVMDMDFSGGTVGTLTRLRLNITIVATGPPREMDVTSCFLNETDVTEDAEEMYENP